MDQAESLIGLKEGFVVYNKHTGEPICKLKSSPYVRVHHTLLNHGVCTSRDIYKLIAVGEWKEFIAYFPEYKDTINEHFEEIQQYFISAQREMDEIRLLMIFEKDFSLFDQKPCKHLAILVMKSKQTNLFDIFMKVYDEKQKIKFLLNVFKS